MSTLYRRVAGEIIDAIERDIYRPGDRLPGVRRLAQQYDVSIATALEACRLLEDQGRLEARQRAGFFVRLPTATRVEEPAISSPPPRPNLVRGQELALQLVKAANDSRLISFGAAVPAAEYLPLGAVNRAVARSLRECGPLTGPYAFPPGDLALRRQIARRMTEFGCPLDPDDLVITNGCQEALGLALRAITEPGDVVAVESPAYYGLFQVLDFLGLKALEIPTHPREGISLEALEFALEQWPVKAVIATPNFSNPLGSCISDTRKRALVKLLARRQIPLVEDDIYGDLGFDGERPRPMRSFDRRGDTVIHCSSFSKTLAPGLRVGWIAPGRLRDRVEYLKFVMNLAAPTLPQLAVADLLARGGYDRYLRQVRQQYETAIARVTQLIEASFPTGTRVTQPRGGFVLWVEFPEGVDAEQLYTRALERGICIAPGPMFSATGKYRNCIRLNCAVSWDARSRKALVSIGQLARELLS